MFRLHTGLTSLIVRSAVIALGALSVGCGLVETNTETRSQAIGPSACSLGVPCEVSFQLPSGIKAANLAISAEENILVGSGSSLYNGAGEDASIASSEGRIEIHSASSLGTVRTNGHVFVGGGSVIAGDFIAGTYEAQAGSIVPPVQIPVGEPGVATWSITFPSTRGPNINVEQSDPKTLLVPGAHGSLRLAPGAKIKLQTGTYFFDSITLEPDSVVELDNAAGTVVINVLSDFIHRGQFHSLGSASDVLVTCLSLNRIDLGDEFDGTLVAPYGEIGLSRPRSGGFHDGQFFGKKVSLQGSAKIRVQPTTSSGSAIDDLGATFDPGDGVVPPVPVPELTDQTDDEWDNEVNDFITALIDSGYSGPPIELDVHPDSATVQDQDDYNLPDNGAVTAQPAPPIEPRSVSVPDGFWQGAEPLNPIRDDETGPDAAELMEDDIEAVQDEITTDSRFEYLGMDESVADPAVEYGTEPEALTDVPQECIFSKEALETPEPPTSYNGDPIGSIDDFVLQDVVDPVILGNKPEYLSRNEDETSPDYRRNSFDSSKAPKFDGYWFFEAGIQAGWNGEGMEGHVDAGMYAGIVAFRKHAELLRFYISATGALLKQTEFELGPYFASELETEIIGKKSILGVNLPNWEAVNGDVTRAKLKTDLLNATVLMFPDESTAPQVRVGPFALIFNGGAQVKIPLSLDLDRFGPEITLAPMFRVFVTIFAGVDIYVAKIGVTGEADIIRVDMPFKAKVKWRDYLTPETCYSSADFDVTFQTTWSTLNGNLKVSVTGKLPVIGEVKIVDKKIVSWTGLEFSSPEVSLIPTLSLPLFDLPANKCTLGNESCVFRAEARQVGTLPEFWDIDVPYTTSECEGQHVFEIDMAGRGLDEVWIRRSWDDADNNSEAICEDSMVQVFTFRQLADGTWEEFNNSYAVTGTWDSGINNCQTVGAGLIGPGTPNTVTGFPYSWVDTSGGVQKVRVIVAGGSDCAQRSLSLGVTTTP